jgi:hypothetical protein
VALTCVHGHLTTLLRDRVIERKNIALKLRLSCGIQLSFTACVMARFISNPSGQHFAQARRAAHKLSNTRAYRLANGSALTSKETLVIGIISTMLTVWGPSGLLLGMLCTLCVLEYIGAPFGGALWLNVL